MKGGCAGTLFLRDCKRNPLLLLVNRHFGHLDCTATSDCGFAKIDIQSIQDQTGGRFQNADLDCLVAREVVFVKIWCESQAIVIWYGNIGKTLRLSRDTNKNNS